MREPCPLLGRGFFVGGEMSGDEGERITRGRSRLQVVRTGERKLFDEGRRAVFLEWFAATCNVKMSAEQAGINYKTAFRHRMQDEEFRAQWNLAEEQGLARIRAKMMETKSRETPIGIEGDLDAPELEEIDPAIAMQLVRDQERRQAGHNSGGTPRPANSEEVRKALVTRLARFGIRADDEGEEQDG